MKKNESAQPKFKKFLAIAFCALSVSALSGCIAAAAAGAGAATYYALSDVEYTAPVNMDKAWNATLAGMADMNLLAEAKRRATAVLRSGNRPG